MTLRSPTKRQLALLFGLGMFGSAPFVLAPVIRAQSASDATVVTVEDTTASDDGK